MDTRTWLQEKLAEEAGMKPESIAFDDEFEQLSLDSLSIITLTFDIESYIGKELVDPTIFSQYNTINSLAEWLDQQK